MAIKSNKKKTTSNRTPVGEYMDKKYGEDHLATQAIKGGNPIAKRILGDDPTDMVEDYFLPNTDTMDEEQFDYLQKTQDEWNSVTPPTLSPLDLEQYTWQQDLKAKEYTAPKDLKAEQMKTPEEVAYRAALAKLAQGSPDVQAERVAANTAEAAALDRSAMEDVSTDPGLRDAQMKALQSLTEIGESGGMTDADKAQLARIQSQAAQADRGRRDAIMQGAARRGMGGGGMELLAQLQSSQAATDRQSQEGLDIAGMAQNRALQALAQAGTAAGGLRSQDFGEQSAVAQARDAIAQFNAANSQQANLFNAGAQNNAAQFNAGMAMDAARTNKASNESMSQYNAGVQNNMAQFNTGNQLRTDLANRDALMAADQYNTGARNNMAQFNQGNNINVGMYNTTAANQAARDNWQGKQGLANANVDGRNKETTYNTVDRPQQQFDNKHTVAKGRQSANKEMADFWKSQGDQEVAEKQGRVEGAGQIFKGIMSFSDEKSKKNVKKVSSKDISEFLKSVQPVSYEYKAEIVGEDVADGPKVGHLMGDIEDTKVGKLISRDMPNGMKGYDRQGMEGAILAALKMIADKIEKKG